MKMKHFVILAQLLFTGVLFFSCNKSEVIDNSLPIRSELPLCRYTLSSIDSTNKEAAYDLLKQDAIVIQSDADLEDCLNEIETFFDKDFRNKYPEYSSVDFSRYTMIVHSFWDPYNPANLVRSKSYFYNRDNVSDQYKSESASYYYLQNREYYAESNVSDERFPLIYISGIVVDKIPENEKVTTVVGFGLITPKK